LFIGAFLVAAFSADSALLASGSDDGTIRLWDVTASGGGACRQIIAGATAMSETQKLALKALGAVEK
jgi:WD40 repeat protein